MLFRGAEADIDKQNINSVSVVLLTVDVRFAGLRNRAVASHNMNEFSSRSHTILTVYITSEQKVSSEKNKTSNVMHVLYKHYSHDAQSINHLIDAECRLDSLSSFPNHNRYPVIMTHSSAKSHE